MITKKGRLVYIEPNDIRNNLSGLKLKNGDNIYWRPEDLNISVDLQVFLPDRDSCGSVPVDDRFLVNISASNDFERQWSTFFGGTEISKEQNYLTTEYTNISYQEIRGNKAGGKESLGIQSIDIQFDSHFFPIVKMKLIDVRGYSLMMPAEIQYDENVKSDASRTLRRKACEQFFDAIFHFPYPRFALSIKGYYGDRVTLMLAVNDFQSSFNSQTGNFEVEISFIGHMYGLYADLPTSLLFIAPYISGNGDKSSYWKSQTSGNGSFFLSDGTPIPTFKEVIESFDKMSKTFKEKYGEDAENYTHLTNVDNLTSEGKMLTEIVECYEKLFTDVMEASTNTLSTTKTFEQNTIFVYFTDQASINLPSSEELDKKLEEYKTFRSGKGEIKKPADGIEWGTQVSTMDPLFNDTGDEIVDGHQYKAKLKGKITEIGKDMRGKRVLLLQKDKNFFDSINSRRNQISTESEEEISKATGEINDVARKILGFVPSIENIIRIIFAHIDAFVTEFYTLLSTIKGKMNNQRLFKNVRYPIEYTNVSSNGSIKYFIPPFTTFYEHDKTINENVRVYPGNVPSLKDKLDEVKFIDKLFNAAGYAMPQKQEETEEEQEQEDPQQYPTDSDDKWKFLWVGDLLFNPSSNPYRKVAATPEIIEKLSGFVLNRFSNAYAYGSEITDSNVSNEVENFLAIHKNYLMVGEQANKKFIEEIDKEIEKLTEKNNGGNIERFDFDESYYGLHILKENSTEDYPEEIKKYVNTNWDYTVNTEFEGNIVVKENHKITRSGDTYYLFHDDEVVTYLAITTEERKRNIELSRQHPEWFRIMTIPWKTKDGEKKDKISNLAYDKEGNVDYIDILSGLIGTSDVFRFDLKKRIFITRMPKVVALFLGRSEYGNDLGYWNLNEDGLYYNADFKNKDDRYYYKKVFPEYLDGETRSNLKSYDKQNALINYYDSKKPELDKIKLYLKEWHENAQTDTNLIRKATTGEILFSNVDKNRNLINSLITLCNSTVDVAFLCLFHGSGYIDDYSNVISFFRKLKEKLEEGGKKENNTSSENNSKSDATRSSYGFSVFSDTTESARRQKEQLYYTCADLYDKWFAGYSKERFLLKPPRKDNEIKNKKINGELPIDGKTTVTEIDNFIYIDTFYNDIGQKFMVDPKIFVNALLSSSRRNALQTITDIVEKSKLLFIPLPVYTNMYDDRSIASIFTPQGLYGCNEYMFKDSMQRGIGSTYVIMYTHQPSSHANTSKNVGNTTAYANDVFDIADSAGNISPTSLSLLAEDKNGSNYKLPAFGVTFGSQNQMYFKGISVNMSNPKETEEAIANRFILAEMERKGDTRMAAKTTGQNLYSIYSNRSYDCTVEMLGCMNIMPLLYFQLNNIPIFKGGYRIVTVKHHIENGSMTTTFMGTRINKTAIPLNNNVIDIEGLFNKMKESGAYNGPMWYGSTVVSNFDRIDNSLATFDIPAALNRFKKPMRFTKKDKKTGKTITFDVTVYDSVGKYVSCCAAGVRYAVAAGFHEWEGWDKYKHSFDHTNGNIYGPNTSHGSVGETLGVKAGDTVKKWINGFNGWYCREILTWLGFRVIGRGVKTDDGRIKLEINLIGDSGVSSAELLPGDIACTLPEDLRDKGHPWGHVEMFDGTDWMADCRQVGKGAADVYPGSRNHRWEIYRYGGPTIQVEGKRNGESGYKGEIVETKDKEGLDLWLACCENMADFYMRGETYRKGYESDKQNGIHTYRGWPIGAGKAIRAKYKPPEGMGYLEGDKRQSYFCPLFSGYVMDDCSAIVSACLNYFGHEANIPKLKNLSLTTANMQPGKNCDNILRDCGFERIDYCKVNEDKTRKFTFMDAANNGELKKGDIICTWAPPNEGDPPGHAEVYWGYETVTKDGEETKKHKGIGWGWVNDGKTHYAKKYALKQRNTESTATTEVTLYDYRHPESKDMKKGGTAPGGMAPKLRDVDPKIPIWAWVWRYVGKT